MVAETLTSPRQRGICVVKVELVFTGGCDGYVGVGAGALESLVTVAMSAFLSTERLDASGVEALDQFFQQDGFDVLLGDVLGDRSEQNRLLSSKLNVNRAVISACRCGTPLGWTPEASPSSEELVATEL